MKRKVKKRPVRANTPSLVQSRRCGPRQTGTDQNVFICLASSGKLPGAIFGNHENVPAREINPVMTTAARTMKGTYLQTPSTTLRERGNR